MYKWLFFILFGIIALCLIVFGPRVLKGISKKKDRKNCYAIRNVKTGTCIRPYNADFKTDNKVILYGLHNWECITWQPIKTVDDTYLLKNLYTEKTFEPCMVPDEGVTLWQKPLGFSDNQFWVIESVGDFCKIKLSGTELYLTASFFEQNAEIELHKDTGDDSQLWKMIPQCPIV